MVWGAMQRFYFHSHWIVHCMKLVVGSQLHRHSQVLNIIIHNFIWNCPPHTVALGCETLTTSPSLTQCHPSHLAILFMYYKWIIIRFFVWINFNLKKLHSIFLDIGVHSLGTYQRFHSPLVSIQILPTTLLYLQRMSKDNQYLIRDVKSRGQWTIGDLRPRIVLNNVVFFSFLRGVFIDLVCMYH